MICERHISRRLNSPRQECTALWQARRILPEIGETDQPMFLTAARDALKQLALIGNHHYSGIAKVVELLPIDPIRVMLREVVLAGACQIPQGAI